MGWPKGKSTSRALGGLTFSVIVRLRETRNRWDILRLDGPLYQPHGLITDSSPRCQERRINTVVFQHPGHFSPGPVGQRLDMATDDMAHE